MKKLLCLFVACVLFTAFVYAGGSQDTIKEGETDGSSIKVLGLFNEYAFNGVTDGKFDINENPVLKSHEEESGIDVEWEMLPKDNQMQKIATVLASGTPPDLMVIQSRDTYFQYAGMGGLEDLGSYIENAGHVVDLIGNASMDFTKYNGKIYGIPFIKGDHNTNVGLVVRKDILDSLGLENPKTLDEFYNTLKIIKEKTGKIPLTLSAFNLYSYNTTLGLFMGSFDLGYITTERNGKLSFSAMLPEYKNFLIYFKKLYDEQLLDNEFAINKGNQTFTKYMAEQVVMSLEGYWNEPQFASKLVANNPKAHSIFIMPPSGNNGYLGATQNTGFNATVVIPKDAENKQAAFNFIDYLCSEKGRSIQNYGVEGYGFGDAENATPEQILNSAFVYIYQLVDSEEGFALRVRRKNMYTGYKQLLSYPKRIEPMNIAPAMDVYADLYPSISTHILENTVKFIMGARSLSEFDKFVNELEEKGAVEAMAAVNEWYVGEGKETVENLSELWSN